ncbi:MAG: cache domain-containing protein [Bryobacteraceae bacterium]|nr:cache domain-containing protein [Bryobacteraceae bacterium]
MRLLANCIGFAVATVILTTGVAAQERGTREEAKALTDTAVEHIKKVGAQRAYDDFTHDKATWNRKDLYIVAYDEKSVALAHGANEKLVGKDMSGIKDASGNPIVPALLAQAKKGGGWYDYDWPDPITKKVMGKSTFARKNPAGDGWVGVGIYR